MSRVLQYRVVLLGLSAVALGLVILSAPSVSKLNAASQVPALQIPVNSVDVNRSNIIFYNRVPKCASTTTYTIMKALSTKNHYIYKIYNDFPLIYFYRDPKEEERLVDAEFERLKNVKTPIHRVR